jgi:hypothetical protein
MKKIREEGESNPLYVDPKGPVYDNCDRIRSRIREFLAEGIVTLTGWLKFIGNINNKAYHVFMGYDGKGAGASNGIYPAAYWFFEQKRVMEGQPKSDFRIKAEENWGPKGYPLKHDHGRILFTWETNPNPDLWDIDIQAEKRRLYGSSDDLTPGDCDESAAKKQPFE